MMTLENVDNLWLAIMSIIGMMIWLIPLGWIISAIDAVVMNELLPLFLGWVVGAGTKDADYVRGRVKIIWDDVASVVSYLKKAAIVFVLIYFMLRLGDAVWYILGA